MGELFGLAGEEALLLGVLATLAVLVVLQLVQWGQIRRLRRQYRSLLGDRGPSDRSLEEVLQHHLANVKMALEKVAALEVEVKRLRRRTQVSALRPGMVKFNAFSDTGGEMSFSLALLDHDLTGAVITSMYGRNESFVYAKPVERGKSSFNMTNEEVEAIERTRQVDKGA